MLEISFVHPLSFLWNDSGHSEVFPQKQSKLEKNPDASQSPALFFTSQSSPSSSCFLLPVTSVLLRGNGAACSVFWVCFHGVSARTKLPKMVISLIGHPSAKCLGKTFKNLENIFPLLRLSPEGKRQR